MPATDSDRQRILLSIDCLAPMAIAYATDAESKSDAALSLLVANKPRDLAVAFDNLRQALNNAGLPEPLLRTQLAASLRRMDDSNLEIVYLLMLLGIAGLSDRYETGMQKLLELFEKLKTTDTDWLLETAIPKLRGILTSPVPQFVTDKWNACCDEIERQIRVTP